ncbi:HET-domain-containing protein [Hypoxylon trugodes]|uniref:HET-domain-containing protein n=1 Tax=Hypoxylon trugodes TaxID=326681 RepID=UPI002190C47A|nr:HET-domain-containing protein [Hypoxylon trugodes]KAI1390721.1 HET-domain-containing protein [Hypoxylon trugodes]
MPVFNQYHYRALLAEDETRFIILDSATREDEPLSCSIIHRRRSNQAGNYVAISYVWGEPDFSRSLKVKCDDDISYLKITPNVDVLLRRLRALKVLDCLWLDAICLNQADENEKSQQIPAMGRIFGEAKMVHIWIGPEDHSTAKLFTFFRYIALLPEVEKVNMASNIVALMNTVFGNAGVMLALESFGDFSERPWFSRRWIIQEACLARRAIVHCGGYSVPLSSLVLAAERYQTLDMSSYPIKVMANLRKPTENLTILQLLWNFHEAQCLEPKDRVAALLGLVRDANWFCLDYTAHWTEVYKQVVSGIFVHGDNDMRLQVMLHLFEFGSVMLPDNVPYPSWIPNWSNSRVRDLPYDSFIRNLDTYEAYPDSLGHSEKATLKFCDGALRIDWHASLGTPRDLQVVYATKCGSLPVEEEERAEHVVDILKTLLPLTPDSASRILALSSLVKVIVEFRQSGRDLGLKSSPSDKFIRSIVRKLPKSLRTEVLDALRELNSLLQDFCLFELGSGGSEFETNTGYGMSSQQIQVGDVMVPLWNTKWEHYERSNFLSQAEATMYLSTMLAVRRTKDQIPQDTANVSEDTETGRIVGWAVCAIPKNKQSLENGEPSNGRRDDSVDKAQWCSMRLL